MCKILVRLLMWPRFGKIECSEGLYLYKFPLSTTKAEEGLHLFIFSNVGLSSIPFIYIEVIDALQTNLEIRPCTLSICIEMSLCQDSTLSTFMCRATHSLRLSSPGDSGRSEHFSCRFLPKIHSHCDWGFTVSCYPYHIVSIDIEFLSLNFFFHNCYNPATLVLCSVCGLERSILYFHRNYWERSVMSEVSSMLSSLRSVM